MPRNKDDLDTDLDAALKEAAAEEAAADEAAPAKAQAQAHAILTDKEVEEAKEEARRAIDKERKATARKALIAEETLRLQREEGLVSGDPIKDERVSITIDLPEFSNSITINLEPFWHGHTYNVPRHVANSLREQMQRAWMHQDEIDGKSTAQNLQNRRDTILSPVGVKNAPQVAA